MVSKAGSLETQDIPVVDGEIQLTPQTALAARIMYRELLRASHDHLKKTGQLKVIHVGPKKESC